MVEYSMSIKYFNQPRVHNCIFHIQIVLFLKCQPGVGVSGSNLLLSSLWEGKGSVVVAKKLS